MYFSRRTFGRFVSFEEKDFFVVVRWGNRKYFLFLIEFVRIYRKYLD